MKSNQNEQNKAWEGSLSVDGQFSFANKPNQKLMNKNINPAEFKEVLRLIHGSFKQVALKVGISESRFHQIFIGYDVPILPDTIRRYALAWNMDVVLLTQVFDQLRSNLFKVGDVCDDQKRSGESQNVN